MPPEIAWGTTPLHVHAIAPPVAGSRLALHAPGRRAGGMLRSSTAPGRPLAPPPTGIRAHVVHGAVTVVGSIRP
ncbi:hypothetical protein JCM4914_73200 [Streptomyces platensis subsp. malvinus]